jgi:hypothetical protein
MLKTVFFLLVFIIIMNNYSFAESYDFHGYLRNQNLWTTNFETKIYSNIYFDSVNNQNLKFSAKYRPIWISNQSENELVNLLDYAYFDWELKPGIFINLGKENIREGVGLSYNPTDFLAAVGETDYSKLEEERRWDREGINLLKLDCFQNNYNFSVIGAEKNRFLLKVYSLIFDSDISFLFYSSEHPAWGYNFAKTFGENVEFHQELSAKWGSERNLVEKTNGNFSTIDPQDNNRVFLKYLIGGHCTFNNQTNLILEYYFLEDGLNQGNFTNLYESIKTNYPQFNHLITYGTLRQNYFFVRLNNPQFLNLNITFSLLKNLDDGSFVNNNQASHTIFQDFSLDFGISIFDGKENSEFGLIPYKKMYWAGMKWSF